VHDVLEPILNVPGLILQIGNLNDRSKTSKLSG
jgi:hypothetical protein